MYEKQLDTAKFAAKEAQKLVLEVYKTSFAVMTKDDNSPVTRADLLADEKIREIIKKNFPSHAILTEESEDDLSRLKNECVWIIDPVDGTKDFVERTGEFTINIAFVVNKRPVVGVILVPAQNKMYYASLGEGSYEMDLVTKEVKRIYTSTKKTNLIALMSNHHVSKNDVKYLEQHQDRIKEVRNVGSSLKACLIASGVGDIQCKIGPGTKEWDIAASHIIVHEAGGVFIKPNGEKFVFNKEDVHNHEGFIILNKFDSNMLFTE
jgi:3'(2'), 5'-bisphosphate nucleotidase